MREIIVNYLILDEDEERLKKITEEYKKQGLNLSEDKMFENIMCCGSKYDVDSKLKLHEWKLGLREDYNQKAQILYDRMERNNNMSRKFTLERGYDDEGFKNGGANTGGSLIR